MARERGNAFPGVWKNESGGAVEYKEQEQNCIQTAPPFCGDPEPESCRVRRDQADPEHTGTAEADRRPQTDISVKMKGISGIIPVAQMPEGIEQPSGEELNARSEQCGQNKNDGDAQKERTAGGSFAREQKMEQYAAGAVYRKPRTVEKSTVHVVPSLGIHQENLPQKSAAGAEKEEKDFQ